MSTLRRSLVALCILGSFVIAAPAQGQSIQYVDEDAAAGVGPCTDPNDPCDQIADATAVAGAGSTIFVGADVYSESVTLNSGISLIASNFNPVFTADNGGVTAIDGGAGNGILAAAGTIAREIRGFTIEGDADAIELQGGAGGTTLSIIGNTLPSRDTQFDSRIQISDGTGPANVTVEGNAWTFGALTTTIGRIGIDDQTNGPLNAVVRSNTFDGLSIPLRFTGSDPLITGNTLTRVYEDDVAGIQSRAITLTDSSATIEGNSIAADATSSVGILIVNTGAPVDSLVLRRSSVTGFDSYGLSPRGIAGTADTVTVSDSLFTSADYPVQAQGLNGPGSLSLTGVTLQKDSGSALYLDDVRLLLDSSILVGGISSFGADTCASSFSRGPTTGTPGDLTDCNDFATTAPPGFMGGGDFRLAAGSPMIDAGNPANGSGLDLAGSPRSLPGTYSCPPQAAAVRDIGAYEFAPTAIPQCPAVAPLPGVPLPGKTIKCKKPKKKKGKKAGAAAKKKKGCKKKKRKKG